MRVIITLSDSHPELLKDLESTSPRKRAQRLSLLAYLGLMTEKGAFTGAAVMPPPETSQNSSSNTRPESTQSHSSNSSGGNSTPSLGIPVLGMNDDDDDDDD